MSFYSKISTLPKQVGSLRDNFRNSKNSRQCNCKRSNCLKLYCECFANGVYCNPKKCNCNSCFNNSENEVHRRAAVELTMDRNPNAFRPKIVATVQDGDGSTRHHKGYCECFQANTACSERCRCSECKNFSGSNARDISDRSLLIKNPDERIEIDSNTSESMDPYPTTTNTTTTAHQLQTNLEQENHSDNENSLMNKSPVASPFVRQDRISLKHLLTNSFIEQVCLSLLNVAKTNNMKRKHEGDMEESISHSNKFSHIEERNQGLDGKQSSSTSTSTSTLMQQQPVQKIEILQDFDLKTQTQILRSPMDMESSYDNNNTSSNNNNNNNMEAEKRTVTHVHKKDSQGVDKIIFEEFVTTLRVLVSDNIINIHNSSSNSNSIDSYKLKFETTSTSSNKAENVSKTDSSALSLMSHE
eukprot:gene11734-24613_t